MRDYPYVCGADIHSIANKAFVRFETAKSRDIVVALDKSNIPFSAKYNDTEIVLTYDGNYKDSVDEVVNTSQMEYLMKFKNPLEIVVEYWLNDSAYNSPLLGEEIESVIYQIVDKGDADSIYEMESDETEEPTIDLM